MNYADFDLLLSAFTDNAIRISRNDVSPEEFREKYENKYIPVVVTDDQQNWLANKKWSLEVCIIGEHVMTIIKFSD